MSTTAKDGATTRGRAGRTTPVASTSKATQPSTSKAVKVVLTKSSKVASTPQKAASAVVVTTPRRVTPSSVREGRRPLDGDQSEDESTEDSSESDDEVPRRRREHSTESKGGERVNSTQKSKPMARALPPPPFTGRDFNAFKTKFESAAERNQYDEQELKTHLTYALTGKALTIVSDVGLGKEPWGYDEMIKCLDVRHGRNKAGCDIWHLIQRKVRGKRQSVHHYADEFKSIIASSKMMLYIAIQLAFVLFINGLSTTPDVHAHVLRKDREGTLSNVVAIAVKHERDHGMTNRIDGCTPAWDSVEHKEVVRTKETAIANANEVMQLLQRDLIQSREAREAREVVAVAVNVIPSNSQTQIDKQAVEIRDLKIKRLRLEQETINRVNFNNNRGRGQSQRGRRDDYRSDNQPRQATPPPPPAAPAAPVAVVNTQQQA